MDMTVFILISLDFEAKGNASGFAEASRWRSLKDLSGVSATIVRAKAQGKGRIRSSFEKPIGFVWNEADGLV